MIEFKTVKYKNFQSVGNAGMTIELDRSQNTLLGGNNGSGKSTVLEALSYCLFGKPLKKVTLSGLINSINRKGLETECVFYKYGNQYKVIRGQKPKVFKIYENDELLDQNANSKDYQNRLENILGMDHKLFTQVVLLNRERYVPFMDMDAADRRKVVEDILDINVFAYMNKVVKSNVDTLKTQISDIEYERGLLVTKRDGVEKLIEQAQSNIDEQVEDLKSQITVNVKRIDELDSENVDLDSQLEAYDQYVDKHKKLKTKKEKLGQFSSKFSDRMNTLKKENSFYEDNDECPTCSQPIDEQFKNTIVDKNKEKQDEIKAKSAELVDEVKKVIDDLKKVEDVLLKKDEINQQITKNNNEMSYIRGQNSDLNRKIKTLSEKKVDDNLNEKYSDLDKQVNEMDVTLNELMLEREEYETMRTMLKDDGIKASIVDDYVGFINKRMNEYLNHMGFFINITLDGNFNEQINSISREGFTYNNLSTGQKTRVNLAILMVLLEVSGMKNSAVTNLLFIDELLENLDQDGVSLFMDLIKEKMKHKNIFVITQRYDEFKDYFRSEIYFKLGEDGFTQVQH